MIETKIYVGLNDSQTKKQEHLTITYVSLLKKVCQYHKVPFSVSLARGGYMHEDGEYTEETTLVISLIDAEKETVNGIAEDLCVAFHQESVLITEGEVRSYYVTSAGA